MKFVLTFIFLLSSLSVALVSSLFTPRSLGGVGLVSPVHAVSCLRSDSGDTLVNSACTLDGVPKYDANGTETSRVGIINGGDLTISGADATVQPNTVIVWPQGKAINIQNGARLILGSGASLTQAEPLTYQFQALGFTVNAAGDPVKVVNNVLQVCTNTTCSIAAPAGTGHAVVEGQLNVANSLVVDGSGNVGIGTTVPGAKLDVNGKFKIRGANDTLLESGIFGSTDNCGTMSNRWIKLGEITANGAWGGSSGIDMDIYPFSDYLNTRQRLSFHVRNNDADLATPQLLITTLGGNGSKYIKDAKAIRVSGTGISNNVVSLWVQLETAWACGSSTGTTLSHYYGNWTVGPYLTAQASSAVITDSGAQYGLNNYDFSSSLTISGNVGVGTTSPNTKFEVVGNINSTTGAIQTAGVTRIDNSGVGTFAAGTTVGGAAVTAGGGLNSVQTFSTSGTWTKPSGVTKVLVEVQGGGGGGGGAAGDTSYGRSGYYGGKGGAGGFCRKIVDVSAVSTVAVTVGAGGGGGTRAYGSNDNGSPGTAGGASSFGAYTTANGGAGGCIGQTGCGGAGGTCGSGDVAVTGESGSPGYSPWYGSYLGRGLNSAGHGGNGGSCCGNPYALGNNGDTGTAGNVVVWEYK